MKRKKQQLLNLVLDQNIYLKNFGIQKTSIDTKGYRDLIDLVEQTCNDTWALYSDLQLYNPYTNTMLEDLKYSLNQIEDKLKEKNNE